MLLSHEPAAREYVLGRLDRSHITDLAQEAKAILSGRDEAVELCYMPGDATWYSLVITPVLHVVGAAGGGHVEKYTFDQSYIGVHGPMNVFVIFHAQSETAVFCSDQEDWEWVATRFPTSEASQLAIAELLKEVFS